MEFKPQTRKQERMAMPVVPQKSPVIVSKSSGNSDLLTFKRGAMVSTIVLSQWSVRATQCRGVAWPIWGKEEQNTVTSLYQDTYWAPTVDTYQVYIK